MIERIARAMCVVTCGSDGGDNDPYLWLVYRDEARAVFAAIREPNEAMLNAARDWSCAKYGMGIGNDAAIGCYQSMIDAALREVEA